MSRPDPEPSSRSADGTVLGDVAAAFGRRGALLEAVPWGSGHIHDTYRVTTAEAGGARRTLLQRINTAVFANPRQLASSIGRVTDHLRAKCLARGLADVDRRVLRPLEACTREHVLYREADGTWWRAYPFLEGARSHDRVVSPAVAREAARAFGAFQRDLADLPPPRLPEAIPHFHDTPRRLAALTRAVRDDAEGRARGAATEIAFAESRQGLAPLLLEAHAAGEVPERVTHNDTKINNVLFDEATGDALCVIDLDTVMPGLGLYDFGDLVRTSTCSAAEDETDLEQVRADPRLFAALAAGYLDAMGDLLTPAERALLALAGSVITYEVGVRFLTDHLQGDVYFRITRPGQNLDRARAQFALLRSLEAQEETFRGLIGDRRR